MDHTPAEQALYAQGFTPVWTEEELTATLAPNALAYAIKTLEESGLKHVKDVKIAHESATWIKAVFNLGNSDVTRDRWIKRAQHSTKPAPDQLPYLPLKLNCKVRPYPLRFVPTTRTSAFTSLPAGQNCK